MPIQFNTSFVSAPAGGLYITQADLEAVIPADELLQLADRNGDDAADAVVISAAIATAAARMHSYLTRRYALPLDSDDSLVMGFVKPGLVDLAWEALYPRADMVSREHKERVEKFIEQLEAIRDGAADLPASAAPAPSGPSTAVHYSASARKTKGGLP